MCPLVDDGLDTAGYAHTNFPLLAQLTNRAASDGSYSDDRGRLLCEQQSPRITAMHTCSSPPCYDVGLTARLAPKPPV